MRYVTIALLGLALLTCKSTNPALEDTKQTRAQPSTQPGKDATETGRPEAGKREKKKLSRVVDKPKEVALYDTPTERRLYASRAWSSEYFNQDLHPFFAIDNDDKTGWGFNPPYKESAWLRLSVSEVQGATSARLRLKSIATELGSPKELVVKALPGEQAAKFTLTQSSDWQEVVLDLTQAPVGAPVNSKGAAINGFEISFGEVYEGSATSRKEWRDYIEISEVEVFVTGLTKENAAFEKEKLESVLTWKKARSMAAKLQGTPLPMAAGYKGYYVSFPDELVDLSYQEEPEYDPQYDFDPNELLYESAFKALRRFVPSQGKGAIDRAELALESDEKSWVPLNVASLSFKPYVLAPKTAGAMNLPTDAEDYLNAYGGFIVPSFEYGTLALQSQLSFNDLKEVNRPKDCEKTAQLFFWRRPETNAETPRELIAQSCMSYEDRGGTETYRITHFLEYDEKGRLELWVSPYAIEWFDWSEGDKSALVSVLRISGSSIYRFIDSASTEPELKDNKPWLVLASSKPLFDVEGEKASQELKVKLIEAGFKDAEIFDSRRAKNLSCCFSVVTAGRYKTKKEAQTAVKDTKSKGFETYTKKGW